MIEGLHGTYKFTRFSLDIHGSVWYDQALPLNQDCGSSPSGKLWVSCGVRSEASYTSISLV